MSRLTFAIILFVAAAGVFIFGILPAWQEVGAMRLEVRELIRVNDELVAIAKKRDELTAQYNAIPQTDLFKLALILPRGLGSAQLLRDLEALATRHGLFLKSLDFVKSAPTSAVAQIQAGVPAQRAYATANMSFNVRGTYDSLRAFLVDLEKMIRVTDISDISFTAQSSVPGTQIFEYALKGAVYFSR